MKTAYNIRHIFWTLFWALYKAKMLWIWFWPNCQHPVLVYIYIKRYLLICVTCYFKKYSKRADKVHNFMHHSSVCFARIQVLWRGICYNFSPFKLTIEKISIKLGTHSIWNGSNGCWCLQSKDRLTWITASSVSDSSSVSTENSDARIWFHLHTEKEDLELRLWSCFTCKTLTCKHFF